MSFQVMLPLLAEILHFAQEGVREEPQVRRLGLVMICWGTLRCELREARGNLGGQGTRFPPLEGTCPYSVSPQRADLENRVGVPFWIHIGVNLLIS